jgi:hypothetical protein
VSRPARARLVILTGLALTVAAAHLARGLPLALLVAGVEVVVYGLLFMDEDGPTDQGGGSDGQRPE